MISCCFFRLFFFQTLIFRRIIFQILFFYIRVFVKLDNPDLHTNEVPLVEPVCRDRPGQRNLGDRPLPPCHQQMNSPEMKEETL